MDMLLDRITCTHKSTIGTLSINGDFECFTLEDVVRADGVKIFGETAIPAGTYNVTVTHSSRFNRDLPLLVGVEGFDGIRIHTGNTDQDTLGCILVGQGRQPDRITGSVLAFNALFPKLQAALAAGEKIALTIRTTAAPVA